MSGEEQPDERERGEGEVYGDEVIDPKLRLDFPLPGDLRDLDSDHLPAVINEGDPEQRSEARRVAGERFAWVCAQIARRNCQRIAHYGGLCRGGNEDDFVMHPFPILRNTYIDWVMGREAGEGKSRESLLVQWARSTQRLPPHRRCRFEVYLWGSGHGPGGIEEAIRIWNSLRGIGVRVRPRQLERGPRSLAEAYEMLLEHDPEVAEAAEVVGLVKPDDVYEIVKALWLDACQTGGSEPIDAARVARYLWSRAGNEGSPPERGQGGRSYTDHVETLARRVDDLVAGGWADWHRRWLGGPRQRTRPDELRGDEDFADSSTGEWSDPVAEEMFGDEDDEGSGS